MQPFDNIKGIIDKEVKTAISRRSGKQDSDIRDLSNAVTLEVFQLLPE